jgi:hypothetical protein
MMKWKLLAILTLLLSLNGCVSSVKDATAAAVEEAQNQVRLRWAEEWKPALLEEAKTLTQEAKEAAVTTAVIELEKYKASNEGRLERIGLQVENFDTNQDGQVSGGETVELLRAIKEKNEESPNPLEWWEILLAVGAAYVPLTGAKELAKSKISGTGNGSA